MPTPFFRGPFRSLLLFHDLQSLAGEKESAGPIRSATNSRRPFSPVTSVSFFVVFAGIIIALHWPYLRLPYFWDEMGQFMPAALDIARDGAWIPHSALPNVHPPGVMGYIALVWSVTGRSILATRVAMLLIAALGLLFVFQLGMELCRPLPAVPALLAPALLLFSPLYYTQSMLAQLDMPAMVLTTLALILFLRQRYAAAAGVSTLLVLVRETGIVAPGLFLLWLLIRERRLRQACYFFAPFVALGTWLFLLKRATGHLLGNQEFTTFNLVYSLEPARAASALVRRFYFLFVADFRWVGTVLIVAAWRKLRLFATPQWALVGLLGSAHVVFMSFFGGATLDRYLLPVLPLVYISMVAAWSMCPQPWRTATLTLWLAGLLAVLFWNFPPSPFVYSLEDDLAMVDFVRVQQQAAAFLEMRLPQHGVTSVWPFTQELSDPFFGYVHHPLPTVQISDFHLAQVAAIDPSKIDVLVVYARPWDRPWTVLQWPPLMAIQRKYYDYEPEATAAEIQERLGLVRAARWERHSQWIEVYVSPELARRQAAN